MWRLKWLKESVQLVLCIMLVQFVIFNFSVGCASAEDSTEMEPVEIDSTEETVSECVSGGAVALFENDFDLFSTDVDAFKKELFFGGNVEKILVDSNESTDFEEVTGTEIKEITEDPVSLEEPVVIEIVEEVEEVEEEIIEPGPVDVRLEYLRGISDYNCMTSEFYALCATIHLEAGEAATMESKCAVGNVVVNRLMDVDKWHYSTITDALYAPRQFSVVKKSKFNQVLGSFSNGNWNNDEHNTVLAAYLACTKSTLYDIPDDVQYFYGSESKRHWGGHTYCFTIGGNSFFK